jgi:hypothetical protein
MECRSMMARKFIGVAKAFGRIIAVGGSGHITSILRWIM